MDFKIATALNLPTELVWFSRQSYEDELSLSSISSSSTDCGPDDEPCSYGGHFPEMPPRDLGSHGTGTKSPRRDDTGDEAASTGDDFTHALFAQEMMVDADIRFEFGINKIDTDQPSSSPLIGHHSPANPPPMSPSQRLPSADLQKDYRVYSPSPPVSPAPLSPDQRLPSAGLKIDYNASPSASYTSPSPLLCHDPMETLQAPVGVSHLQDFGTRRSVSVAPWQRAILRKALVTRDDSRPRRAKLRELAQRAHLTASVVSWWFAEQQRISFHQAKFGFRFTGPASRPSRTIKIVPTGYCRH